MASVVSLLIRKTVKAEAVEPRRLSVAVAAPAPSDSETELGMIESDSD